MTAETAEPSVEAMVAEVVEKAKAEGRQEVLTEAKTMLGVMLASVTAELSFAARNDGTIETRLQGKEQAYGEMIAWVLMTGNGGEMPEEYK